MKYLLVIMIVLMALSTMACGKLEDAKKAAAEIKKIAGIINDVNIDLKAELEPVEKEMKEMLDKADPDTLKKLKDLMNKKKQ